MLTTTSVRPTRDREAELEARLERLNAEIDILTVLRAAGATEVPSLLRTPTSLLTAEPKDGSDGT